MDEMEFTEAESNLAGKFTFIKWKGHHTDFS